jgi:hypothetical protein
MFEDFRKQIDNDSFPEPVQGENQSPQATAADHGNFLGMTPVQRFIVALMLLMMTIVLGILFLMVTSKIALPAMG